MRETRPMSYILQNSGQRPYRELVQRHLRRQSSRLLQEASIWEIANLPEAAQGEAMAYIDATNARFGFDKDFWSTASCQRPAERGGESAR